MKKLLLSFLLSASTAATAQNWTWDTLQNIPYQKLCKDNYQHMYSFSFGGSIITKFNMTGQQIWQNNLPANAELRSIKCAPDSTVYFSGTFSGTLSIPNNTLISVGLTDIFLGQLSPAGNLLWVNQIGSKRDERWSDLGLSGNKLLLISTAADTVFFGNVMYPKPWLDEFFIAKYTLNGNFITAKLATQFPTQYITETYGDEIEGDGNGGIIILHSEYQPYNSYLTKLDTSLMPVWQNTIGGYTQYEHSLKITSNNEILYVESGEYYGSGSDYCASTLMKVSASGNTLSAYPHNRTGHIYDYDLDSCNNIYFTGFGRNSRYALVPKNYLINGMLSSNFNLGWRREDSTNYDDRLGISVVNLSPNKCFVSGGFTNTLSLYNTMSVTPNNGGYFFAVIQHTFGLPTNVSSQSNLNTCSSNSISLACSTGGIINWYGSPTSVNSLGTGPVFNIAPLSPGTYTWYAEATTCTMTSGRLPITVTVNTLPVVTVSNGTVCGNQNFTIVPAGAISYSYSGGSAVVTPSATTNYTVIGTDLNGCKNNALCQVTVVPGPQLAVLSSTANLCRGQSATLTLNGAQSYSFNLQTSSGSHVVTPFVTSSYLIVGSSGVGCTSSMLYTQNVIDCLSTGINEQLTENNFKIYPNPNNGEFFVEVREPARMKVLDVQGRIIFDKQIDGTQKIGLPAEAKGLYIMKVISSGNEWTKKIIVE